MIAKIFHEGNESELVTSLRRYTDSRDILSLYAKLNVIPGFQLRIPHMVFFHMHECCVGICFGKTVSTLESLLISAVFLPLFQKTLQQFYISLKLALSVPSAIDKRLRYFFKKNFQQLLCFCTEYSMFCRHFFCCCFEFPVISGFIFRCALFPHKAVFVGVCFDFCPIYKQVLKFDFSVFCQFLCQLEKQFFCTLRQPLASEPCYLMITRRGCSIQQPDEIDISLARCPYSPGTVNALHVCIHQYFKHD